MIKIPKNLYFNPIVGLPTTHKFAESNVTYVRSDLVEKMLAEQLYLPKINIDVLAMCDETCLIEHINGKPNWTQEAVDFIAALNWEYSKDRVEKSDE